MGLEKCYAFHFFVSACDLFAKSKYLSMCKRKKIYWFEEKASETCRQQFPSIILTENKVNNER
jgi:hypothetical protein